MSDQMLELKFYIVGGYIKMEQKVFLTEILEMDSCLRQVLNWKDTIDFAQMRTAGIETDENGMVTVDIDPAAQLELDQSYTELLSRLKERYGDFIKGKVCCRWLAGNSMSNFVIDLDSEDDKARQA